MSFHVLLVQLGIGPITEKILEGQFEWFGHVSGMKEDREGI